MNIEVGICKTCKHYYEEWFDPSPSGVALSGGSMLDAGCMKEEELERLGINGEVGTDEDHQCPLWEPGLEWCEKHKRWFPQRCDGCEKCLEEMEKDLKELYGGGKC